MSKTQESLQEALRRWAEAQSSTLGEEPPAIEDLIAYRSGKLEGEARLDLEQRLSVDPGAVQELLDLSDLSGLEPPTPEHRLSGEDQARALSRLRKRIGAEPPAPREQDSRESAGETGEPTPASLSRSRSRWRVFGLAAALVVAVTGAWAFRLERLLESERAPRFAAVIDVHATRGEERPFELKLGEPAILLIFHDLPARRLERGVFELSDAAGEKLLSREFASASNAGSLLYLPVSSALLPPGTYRAGIYEENAGGRKVVREYAFALVSSED